MNEYSVVINSQFRPKVGKAFCRRQYNLIQQGETTQNNFSMN